MVQIDFFLLLEWFFNYSAMGIENVDLYKLSRALADTDTCFTWWRRLGCWVGDYFVKERLPDAFSWPWKLGSEWNVILVVSFMRAIRVLRDRSAAHSDGREQSAPLVIHAVRPRLRKIEHERGSLDGALALLAINWLLSVTQVCQVCVVQWKVVATLVTQSSCCEIWIKLKQCKFIQNTRFCFDASNWLGRELNARVSQKNGTACLWNASGALHDPLPWLAVEFV